MTDPIASAMDRLISDAERRHAWLKPAAELVRRWREEDSRNGIEWGGK